MATKLKKGFSHKEPTLKKLRSMSGKEAKKYLAEEKKEKGKGEPKSWHKKEMKKAGIRYVRQSREWHGIKRKKKMFFWKVQGKGTYAQLGTFASVESKREQAEQKKMWNK